MHTHSHSLPHAHPPTRVTDHFFKLVILMRDRKWNGAVIPVNLHNPHTTPCTSAGWQHTMML